MGMFDYIHCEAQLPEAPTNPPHRTFQTKCTPDQYMTTYTITEDGRLVWRPYRIEEVPRADRPYPEANGMLSLAGSIRRVESEPEELDFHGDIYFYEYNHSTGEWWNYRARFTDGRLSQITLIEYEPPKPTTQEPREH